MSCSLTPRPSPRRYPASSAGVLAGRQSSKLCRQRVEGHCDAIVHIGLTTVGSTVVSVNGSWASSASTARSMRSNRSRDTSLELSVRRALHRRGLRYRVDFAPLPGLRSRADIVFTRSRVAVYLDGCFWHGCPVHGTVPVSNAEYWIPKLARNRDRDHAVAAKLAFAGWTVLRFWEHETLEDVVTSIERAARAAAPTFRI